MPPKKVDDSPVFQLKVSLKGSKPPIWRRIQVRGSITLYKLHQILQLAMGWTDSHLHQFIAQGAYYGMAGAEWGLEVKNEQRVKLGQIVANVKDRFVYEYDFGDGWEHVIVVEEVLPPEPGVRYPLCLKGKRACPPEDVGGIWGYEHFLEAMGDPEHPEHADMAAWWGDEFDPEEFDLEEVNHLLRQI
jgi:hypothetical protein